MQTRAQVLDVRAGAVRLRVADSGGCGRCDEPGGCRALRITDAFGLPRNEFVLPSTLALQVGDEVSIRIAEGSALKAALASYGLGALLLIGGAALGQLSAGTDGGDAAALVGGVLGLLLATGVNRFLMRSRNWRRQFELELLPAAPAAAACVHDLAGLK